MRPGRTLLAAAALAALLVWPLIPGVPYDLLSTAILASEYLIVAISLVLLIGLVGQISLGQAAFVGIGAFAAALATKGLHIEFPFSLVVGAAAGATSASLIGVVALRVRGLYLAVATLIVAYVCDQYLFLQPWLVESQSGTSIPAEAIGQPGSLPYFNLSDAHIFYYVALATAAIVLYGVANLGDSKVGRAFAAVRGSEVAAASLGINVTRTKLLGFCCSGALAGLGGALILAGNRTVAPEQFNVLASLNFLTIAVVGGLRSFGGAIASSLLFAILIGEVFFHFPGLSNYLDLISALVLIGVLTFFRGGLGSISTRLATLAARASALTPGRATAQTPAGTGEAAAPAVLTAEGEGAESAAAESGDARIVPVSTYGPGDDDAHPLLLAGSAGHGGVAGTASDDGRRHPTLLSVEHVTVRFGGLTAVDDVSLRVDAGEIVGLIGPNGAGKTTLFNAILGLNEPTEGTVHILGTDVTTWDVHRRAALGVGRTFQILQLFGDLTVMENLLVATHLSNPTHFWQSIAVSPASRRAEARARERVRAVLRLMEMDDLADRTVAGLPFGVLRLIEVARTLVTGAPLVCFDEPASGLDSTETERLLEWFRKLREMGVTLLVIEHDVSFVTRLCDHIYVLDQGALIADGPPAAIRRDPAVIASYLGTEIDAA